MSFQSNRVLLVCLADFFFLFGMVQEITQGHTKTRLSWRQSQSEAQTEHMNSLFKSVKFINKQTVGQSASAVALKKKQS